MLHFKPNFHHNMLDSMKDKLGLFYLHLSIQNFAIALISVFIPVYLFNLGFSFFQVILFLFIQWTIFGLFTPIYGNLINKVGLKEILLIRTPIYVLALYFLNLVSLSNDFQNYYLLIAVLLGFSESIYSLSINTLFAEFIGNKSQGLKTAKMISYPKIASILSPFLGGLFIFYFSFNSLLFLVMLLLILATLPIFFVKDIIDHPKFNNNCFRFLRNNLKDFFYLNIYGIKTMILFVLLPIALYLSSKSLISLGSFISLFGLFAAFFTIFLGKIEDKIGINKLLKFGSVIVTILFILLGFFLNSYLFYFIALLIRVISITIHLPYQTYLYQLSRKNSILDFMIFKEFSLYIGRSFLFVILIAFFSDFSLFFYLGSFFSFLFLFF